MLEEGGREDVRAAELTTKGGIVNRIRKALRWLISQGHLSVRGRFVYSKIEKEVNKNEGSIERLEDLKKLKHVGERSYKKIETQVLKGSTKKNKEKTDKSKSRRNYIPSYRSASYAILRAMHELKSGHKYLIALRAAPYTDTEFSASEKFSAFGAFKVLERRGLIAKEARGRYGITEEGEELGKRLFKETEERKLSVERRISLVIDAREKKSTKERLFFQTYFTKQNIEFTTRFLGLGDFLWIRNEHVLGHIIERKAGSDLVVSLSDGRFREQKRRLKLFNIQAYLLIEKLVCDDDSSKAAIIHSLMEARVEGLIVLETESIQESGWVIAEIDKKVRSTSDQEVMSYGSFIDEGSKGITTSEILLNALLGIKGVSKEVALEIQGRFRTLGYFLEAAQRSDFVEVLMDASVSRKLSHKMAEQISDVFG